MPYEHHYPLKDVSHGGLLVKKLKIKVNVLDTNFKNVEDFPGFPNFII